MAKKDDDLAAALNAMANGDADESHDSSSGSHVDVHVTTPASPPVAPPRARPPVAPPAAAARTPSPAPRPTARVAAPSERVSPPVAPPAVTPTPTTARATGDGQPAARVRSAAPQTRSAASTAATAPQAPTNQNPFDAAPPDDDDAVIMPAPDQSVFAPRAKPAPVVRKAKVPVYQTLHFRQTIIPIMLTSGVLSLVLAGIRFTLPDDSFFAAVPAIVAIVLVIMGIMLLGFGIINMLMVKQMLDDAKPQGAMPSK